MYKYSFFQIKSTNRYHCLQKTNTTLNVGLMHEYHRAYTECMVARNDPNKNCIL